MTPTGSYPSESRAPRTFTLFHFSTRGLIIIISHFECRVTAFFTEAFPSFSARQKDKKKNFCLAHPPSFFFLPSPCLQNPKASASRISSSNKHAKKVSVKKIRNPSADGQQNQRRFYSPSHSTIKFGHVFRSANVFIRLNLPFSEKTVNLEIYTSHAEYPPLPTEPPVTSHLSLTRVYSVGNATFPSATL